MISSSGIQAEQSRKEIGQVTISSTLLVRFSNNLDYIFSANILERAIKVGSLLSVQNNGRCC